MGRLTVVLVRDWAPAKRPPRVVLENVHIDGRGRATTAARRPLGAKVGGVDLSPLGSSTLREAVDRVRSASIVEVSETTVTLHDCWIYAQPQTVRVVLRRAYDQRVQRVRELARRWRR